MLTPYAIKVICYNRISRLFLCMAEDFEDARQMMVYVINNTDDPLNVAPVATQFSMDEQTVNYLLKQALIDGRICRGYLKTVRFNMGDLCLCVPFIRYKTRTEKIKDLL